MKKIFAFSVALFLIPIALFSQEIKLGKYTNTCKIIAEQGSSSEVVFSVGSLETTKNEYIYISNKYNSSLENYLEPYIDYKLKIMCALELNYQKKAEVLNEIEQIRKNKSSSSKSNFEREMQDMEVLHGSMLWYLVKDSVWDKANNAPVETLKKIYSEQTKYQEKSFENSKGYIIADLHDKYEKDFIERLKMRYNIILFKDVYLSMFENQHAPLRIVEGGCIDLSGDTIDLGVIPKSKHHAFYLDIKNINTSPIELEKVELDKMLDYSNMYNKSTQSYGNYNYAGMILAPSQSKKLEITIYPSRGGTGQVIQQITIRYKSGNCQPEIIYMRAYIFENAGSAIARKDINEINKVIAAGLMPVSSLSIEQVAAILQITPNNKKFISDVISFIDASPSIDEIKQFDKLNLEISSARNSKLLKLGVSIDDILKIIQFAPELKSKFNNRLIELAKNFRDCEEIIGDIPEWKPNYESKMANFVSSSNELDRFLKYYPSSSYKSTLILKIANNPTSYEDVMYIVAIEPSQKNRLESKAFELLPKYASSDQCRHFITIYPNSTYKGMVEAQYQAALTDERVSRTMDEKMRQQQQAQPKDDRCTSCGGRGVCLECNGRGSKVCDRHDTNGDGHCTECDDRGYIVCSKCDGKGTCSTCRGKGRRN